jgi:ligand-binding sensor domain-containing protein
VTIPFVKDLSRAVALAFDTSRNLLVGESIFGKVKGAVYRFSAGSQTFTSLGLHKPPGGAIAVDGAGNLYVGGNKTVAVYPPNSQRASRTIKVPKEQLVDALTVNANGELYVGTSGRFESVSEYAPGAKKPRTTFDIPGHVGGLALTKD